jgi:hypothetical protein
MSTPQNAPSNRNLSPTTVAAAGWLMPGAGYWLLGERERAVTVGISVMVLFTAGLLIGGVRSLEVPGYGTHGERIEVYLSRDSRNSNQIVESSGDDLPYSNGVWVLRLHPLDEIRNKPWSIAQVMAGPLSIVGAFGSVIASERGAAGPPWGAKSHARVNEIAVLYTAVAGMLNLLAIIDSAHRAAQGAA